MSVFIPLYGQHDTIRIGEIIISSRQIPSEIPGFKRITIDSMFQETYGHLSFSELLSECSPLFIKSYGYGGAATTSFRGTGASHTQVTWNGMNINSPMLGQSDFSLLNPAILDNVELSFGGASSYIGPGGFGGTVSLENKPVWKTNPEIHLNTGAGSFGRYSGSLRIRAGNNVFQTVTRVFLNQAENNFPYLNNVAGHESLWEKRKNNQLKQKSFMEEIYHKKASGLISAMLWYSSTSRNLPGSMLVAQTSPDEDQYDESFRSIIGYESEKGNTSFFARGSWMNTTLNYTSRVASIYSENIANTFAFRSGFEKKIRNSTSLNVTFTDEYNLVSSNNYSRIISRNYTSLTVSVNKKSGNRFGSSLLLRQMLDGNSFLVPDFSAGIEYRLLAGSDQFIKAGFSRNSRIPSLNDRYWNPGGNPSLRNEYAFQYEAGYQLSHRLSSLMSADAELTCFSNHIRDMIQWQPGKYSWWTAENIGSVNASGFESSLTLKYSEDELSFRINAGYAFTRSVSESKTGDAGKKQLMYIPVNQANGTFYFSYGKIYLFWISDFTGKRFITVDNKEFLPAYFINNIISGIKINIGKQSADLSLKVENLLNTDYQTIAFHPQPGRSFFISLTFNLTK